jgi:hypothetical protein
MTQHRNLRAFRIEVRPDETDVDDGTWLTPREIVEILGAGGAPPEGAFDRYLPESLRTISGRHWTPVRVAAFGARWLSSRGVRSVVDIGSGAGKFCVVGALASDCTFVGIEQRERLVDVARGLARLFRVSDRARFERGVYDGGALPPADAYYLFNPFGENILDGTDHIDHDVVLSDHRYLQDIDAMERTLRNAPAGAYFLIYNGFGGAIPESFEEVPGDIEAPDLLRLWRKPLGALSDPGETPTRRS